MKNIFFKIWLYIGLITFTYNLCETYASVLLRSNPFSGETSISPSHQQRNQDDNHHSLKSTGLAVLKRLSVKSTNIESNPPKVPLDESYTNVPGFVSSSQDSNDTMVDSANTDHCIVCLQSFHTSIKHDIQYLLDSMSSSQNNSNNVNTFENHTAIAIDNIIHCSKININNRDEFETQESQNTHSDLLSPRKCANKRCSAMFHKDCWEQAMKSQLENGRFDLEGELDHIQLKCPHCSYANHNLSDTLKGMIQQKETLIRLRQQTLRLMTTQPPQQPQQSRRQYQSNSSRNKAGECMGNAFLCLGLFPIAMLFLVFLIYICTLIVGAV